MKPTVVGAVRRSSVQACRLPAKAAGVRARVTALVVTSAATVLVAAVPALADAVTVSPSAKGMGDLGTKIQAILNMTAQAALWASLASVLIGAGAWGLSKHFGNYGGAHKGMQLAIGGAIGALLVASAATIVNTMFGA